jgi:hypothetical protein
MRGLSTPELLEAWERGWAQRPFDRALTLLAAACPDSLPEALASLSIGRRDASLLMLREWAFGPDLAGVAVCPHCGERLELNLNVAAMRSAKEPVAEVSLTMGAVESRFRPPNSYDLRAVAGLGMAEARSQLFERCVLEARSGGETVSVSQLPAEVVEAVIERMAEADPQADVQWEIFCSSCGHRWCEVFDIVSFFWTEIDAWARRILGEVHVLALAYGWRESEILALSPSRRQLYLEMVGR